MCGFLGFYGFRMVGIGSSVRFFTNVLVTSIIWHPANAQWWNIGTTFKKLFDGCVTAKHATSLRIPKRVGSTKHSDTISYSHVENFVTLQLGLKPLQIFGDGSINLRVCGTECCKFLRRKPWHTPTRFATRTFETPKCAYHVF